MNGTFTSYAAVLMMSAGQVVALQQQRGQRQRRQQEQQQQQRYQRYQQQQQQQQMTRGTRPVASAIAAGSFRR
jgi:hypothetical protein